MGIRFDKAKNGTVDPAIKDIRKVEEGTRAHPKSAEMK
jgi:hypothetical protein